MNLYPHQKQALQETEQRERVAYYLDMGLGKTFIGCEKMRLLGKRVNLVICQKSKVKDWIDHIWQYSEIVPHDLTSKAGFEEFFNGVNDGFNAGVINYELAWRRKELLMLDDFTLMIDESSLIQNKSAKQTKFILKLKPANVILLSGTPTSGKYENLWTQIHLLGWNISESLYNRHYVNWVNINAGGFTHKVVDKADPYKNIDRLKSKLKSYGAVFMKTEDVFNLPAQTFTTVNVPTSKEYRKFMKTGYVAMDGVELIGDQTFTKRLYSRQLCGMYSEAKLEAFKSILESTNDRLIVFYNFKAELELMKAVCEALERPYSVISGDVKDLSNYENKSESVTLVQYQAGSMGLNLQKANKMIFFSLPERSDHFEQSKARIHRIGQSKPCFYWLLICGIEAQIYQTLLKRGDWTDELFKACV